MALVIDQLLARLGHPPLADEGLQDEMQPASQGSAPTVGAPGSAIARPVLHVRDVSRVNGALQRCSCGHITRTVEQMRQHVALSQSRGVPR